MLSLFVSTLHSQDRLFNEYCTSDAQYPNLYGPYNALLLLSDSSDARNMPLPCCSPTSNIRHGWSTPESHNRSQQRYHSPPLYNQQALIAQAYQSWNEQNFAQEIECGIAHCMAYGYSHLQAEQKILEQHQLYSFANFITVIKKFPGYRSYIKELHQKLLSNQGKFYRLRKAIGCVNSGYRQLRATTEQLYNEIIGQERAKQEVIHNTFNTQRNALKQEAMQWRELLEIYQEERVGDATRIGRRIQTLNAMSNGQIVYTEQVYTLSASAIFLLEDTGGDFALYNVNCGNQLQQVIHQECIEGIEHVAALRPSSTMYSYQRGIAQCFDAAREYNQEGLTGKAATISDFCWTLLDCGLAIAQGATNGVIGAVKDMAEHPVQTAICAVAGEYVLAYQLSKVLYNIADISVTALSDSDKAWQKWDEYVAPVTQLIEALENKQITLRDTLKGATQFAVQWKTQDKFLKGLNSICTTAKAKAIEYAKNNPLSTPQEYMATPEGFLFKSMNETPPSGSSLKYERSSRFFIANHAEITALSEYAQQSMQPPQEILQRFGRNSLYAPESFLKHIFAAELKEKIFSSEKIERSLSGFHHFVPEYLEKMNRLLPDQ